MHCLQRVLQGLGVSAQYAAAIAAAVDDNVAANIVDAVRGQKDDPSYSPDGDGSGSGSEDGDDEHEERPGPAKRGRAGRQASRPPPPPKGAAAVEHRHRQVRSGRTLRARSRLRILPATACALAYAKERAREAALQGHDAWAEMLDNVPPPNDEAHAALPVQGSMMLTREFRNAWLCDNHRDPRYRSPPCLSPQRIAEERKRFELRVFEPWMASGAVFVAAAWREPIAVGRIRHLVHVDSLAQLQERLGPDLAGLGMARTVRRLGCTATEALEIMLDYQRAELDAGVFVLFTIMICWQYANTK